MVCNNSQWKLYGLQTFQMFLFLVIFIFSTEEQSIRKSHVILAHLPTHHYYRESTPTRDLRDLRVAGFLNNFKGNFAI